MEFPEDILMIIREYSKPLTRHDWRLGCYYNRRSYYILGGYMSFDHIIYTLFKVAFLNFLYYDELLIYNELMNNNYLKINLNI
jgi:hypothetical protein